MKLTRRDFLSFAATASLAALLPMPALADEMASDETLSVETLEDGTVVVETTQGTWTIKVEESSSLRTCTTVGPSGETDYFVYDRATGDLYSSITGKTVSIGVDAARELVARAGESQLTSKCRRREPPAFGLSVCHANCLTSATARPLR